MKIYETMERKRQFMRIFIEFTEYLFATNCLFFFKISNENKKKHSHNKLYACIMENLCIRSK